MAWVVDTKRFSEELSSFNYHVNVNVFSFLHAWIKSGVTRQSSICKGKLTLVKTTAKQLSGCRKCIVGFVHAGGSFPRTASASLRPTVMNLLAQTF